MVLLWSLTKVDNWVTMGYNVNCTSTCRKVGPASTIIRADMRLEISKSILIKLSLPCGQTTAYQRAEEAVSFLHLAPRLHFKTPVRLFTISNHILLFSFKYVDKTLQFSALETPCKKVNKQRSLGIFIKVSWFRLQRNFKYFETQTFDIQSFFF